MKNFIQSVKNFFVKIAVMYNENKKFHSFVTAVEYGAVSAFISATANGMSFSKNEALIVLSAVFGGAVGAARAWLKSQVIDSSNSISK